MFKFKSETKSKHHRSKHSAEGFKSGFKFEYRGKVEAKGKGEVEMFFVLTTEASAYVVQ